MTFKQFIAEAAKPKISKKTGNLFVQFKVPANLNKATSKTQDSMLQKIRTKIDAESMAFVGVKISSLVAPEGKNFQLGAIFFLDSEKNVCKVYGTDTEAASGFSLVIAKLTPENAKLVDNSRISKIA